MKLYILNTACIAPLEIYESETKVEIKQIENIISTKLQVVDPVYKERLNLNVIRRVAKFTKMGLFSALVCLDEKVPDAVIVGTGIGGFFHSEKFLLEMVNRNEENLSPNAFLQSLHSSLSGNIAMITKCTGYNITYSNRGISFESTIIDAMLHLREDPSQQILIGASDEITDNYAEIIKKTNYTNNTAQIPSEGAAFMLLSGEGNVSQAYIRNIKVLFRAKTIEIEQTIQSIFEENKLTIEDINVVLADENIFSQLMLLQNSTFIFYKNYVGDYSTSSAFAVWLAEKILKTQCIPALFEKEEVDETIYRNVLIINQFKSNTSIILISI